MGDSFIDVSRRVIEHPTSHIRVLGPPASGTTSLLVERFRALSQRHAGGRSGGIDGAPGDRGAPADGGAVYILTYSAESHKRLTDAVFDKNTARVGPPPVLTYTRLAQEIIESSCGRSPVSLSDLEERLLLEEVIARHQTRMTSELASICRTERFIEDALEACHILLQNGFGEDALPLMAGFAKKSAELSDVLLLYAEFRRAIEKMGAVTYYDVSWEAAKSLRDGRADHPLTRAAAILVEDFQDIDAGQFELLTSVAPPNGRVAVNVFGDPLGSVFSYRGTQHAYLSNEFPRLYGGETFFLPARARSGGLPAETIEALLVETLGDGAGAYLPVGSAGDDGARGELRLETTRDEVDEVWTVAARIASILRTGACLPEEIAVISNNKSSYEPILAAAATQRGIPLDTGRARKGVFGDFVGAVLTVVESPDEAIASRAIVTSPLFPWLRGLFSGPRSDPESAAKDQEALRAFVGEIRGELSRAAPEEWMRIIAVRVLDPLAAAFAKETGDDSAHRETGAVLDAWESYSIAVASWSGRPSLSAFSAVERKLSERRAAGAVGRVSFLSPREAKGRYFPAVFVLGCSELLFPATARGENILPLELVEKALRGVFPERPIALHRARSAARQLSEEHHLLYIALTRSTGSLYVTAPAIFSGEDHPVPSAILDRTVPRSARVVTPPAEKAPPQIRFASVWVEGNSVAGCGAALDRLSPAVAQWHAVKPEASPIRLAPFPLSQSSIGTFLGCKRRFFYQRVLRIPDLETLPARVGTLLHEVMADLGRRFPSKTDLVTRCTPEVIQGAIDDAVRKEETLGQGLLYEKSLRHHLAVMVGWILDLEREEPEGFTIAAAEHNLEFSRGPWEFRGRIDRIDKTPAGETKIVDYKTGRLNKTAQDLRKKTLCAIDRPAEANWQVPLYAWGMKAT
ncbi:MAG: superfamily helicase, partial [Candidatus Krumholzibacteriota bacterium]|nr:superfamily helicase [Candidatus Krumholzibacteriota bacterium]